MHAYTFSISPVIERSMASQLVTNLNNPNLHSNDPSLSCNIQAQKSSLSYISHERAGQRTKLKNNDKTAIYQPDRSLISHMENLQGGEAFVN